MSAYTHGYRAWEKVIICEERGKRVFHYNLRSTSGRCLLAVVGTEKSKNHMTYVVSEDFLQAFGSNATINAETKWSSQRAVVQWLISLVYGDETPPTESDIPLVPEHKGKTMNRETLEKLSEEDPQWMIFPKKLRSGRVQQSAE